MKKLGQFLTNKEVRVKYAVHQFLDLKEMVHFASLIAYDAPQIANNLFKSKLQVSALNDLNLRLQRKSVPNHTKAVNFTFKHSEALAFLTWFTSPELQYYIKELQANSSIIYTLSQLHKHYI